MVDPVLTHRFISPRQGWGNHPDKSGHGLTNILTFDTGLAKLASYMFYYDNKNNTDLTIIKCYFSQPCQVLIYKSMLTHCSCTVAVQNCI